MASGIYQILNQANGKCYIGSSVNIDQRWTNHLSALRQSRHPNTHLQAAFKKYGEAAFNCSILESIEELLQLIPREQHYMDMVEPEYNISPTAGNSLGVRHTPEARANMSRANKGKTFSPETRAKLSLANMGKHPSEKTRANLSKAWTPERRQRASEALTGERNPNFGKHLSEATRAKMSTAHRGKPHPHRSHPISRETRAKMNEGRKARYRRIHAEREGT